MGQPAEQDLRAAVRAYRAAERTVERVESAAAVRIKAARDERNRTRHVLAEAIVAARRAGIRPIDLERTTGYSRERIRTILREHGVEAD